MDSTDNWDCAEEKEFTQRRDRIRKIFRCIQLVKVKIG